MEVVEFIPGIFENRKVMDTVLLWDAMIWTRRSHKLVLQKL